MKSSHILAPSNNPARTSKDHIHCSYYSVRSYRNNHFLRFIALDSLSFLLHQNCTKSPQALHTFVIIVARAGVMFTPLAGGTPQHELAL